MELIVAGVAVAHGVESALAAVEILAAGFVPSLSALIEAIKQFEIAVRPAEIIAFSWHWFSPKMAMRLVRLLVPPTAQAWKAFPFWLSWALRTTAADLLYAPMQELR